MRTLAALHSQALRVMPVLKPLVAAMQADEKLHQKNASEKTAAEVNHHTQQQIGAALLRNEAFEQSAVIRQGLGTS
jgi:hypothetical protein